MSRYFAKYDLFSYMVYYQSTVVLSLRLGPENLKVVLEKINLSDLSIYRRPDKKYLTKQTNKKLGLSEYYP